MIEDKQVIALKQNKHLYLLKFTGLFLTSIIKRKLRQHTPLFKPLHPLSPKNFSTNSIRNFLPEAKQIQAINAERIFLHQYEADKSKNIIGLSIEYPTKTVKAVIKFSKPLLPKLNAFINATNLGYCREKLFYERISSQLPITTPKYINGYADKASGDYFVILERIDDARIIADHENCPLRESCFALQQIAKLHALPLNKIGPLNWIVGNSNDRAFRWIALFFKKHFDPSYIHLTNKLCDYINLLPTSFIHVDFRPGNIFFKYDSSGKIQDMVLFDWVAPTLSVGIYDVVYFMILGMDPNVRRLHYDELVSTYVNQLAKSGIDYDRAQFDTDFQILALLLFTMSSGYKKIGFFDDWNVADMQWVNWESKISNLIEDFDFGLLSEKLKMDKQILQQTVQALL